MMGEADLIRSLFVSRALLQVSTVGEGATGFNVRAAVLTKTILLDEATVYNSSHLFGLFSVFNVDAIKDSKLYKGGIPAKYGGQLSSVLDVRQAGRQPEKFRSNGSIGLIASHDVGRADPERWFCGSGPEFVQALVSKIQSRFEEQYDLFYDLNAKANFTLSDKDRIYLSGYFGGDVFNFGDEFSSDWGNATGCIPLEYLFFSDRLFSNFTAIYSDYGYSFGVPEGSEAFDWDANIYNYVFKGDFSYFLNQERTGLRG
ncbi:MAG: hypothetical protein R2788_08055 [Saprospiraceae bacterium]